MSNAGQPMRVLHLASGDGWGGAEVATFELLCGLAERPDVAVEAILLNPGELAERLRDAGIPFDVVDESLVSPAELRRRVRARAQREHVDVVHAHRYKEILLASTLRLPSRPKLVVTVHGAQAFGDLDWRSRIQIWGSLWVARLAGARFAAVSPELATRFARALGRSCVTRVDNPMPPPVSGEAEDLRRRFGWPDDSAIVGFVGRLEPVKGPDLCLSVLEACPNSVRLVMMGGGSLDEELEHRVERTPDLAERVAFMGETTSPTRYFAQLDALALTSRHEGQPIVLLEAAGAELPVVAFAVGGVSEVLEGAPPEWLVEPDDCGRMAAALTALLEDPGAAREGARAWSAVLRRRHGRQTVVDRYMALYRADHGALDPTTAAAAEPAGPGE